MKETFSPGIEVYYKDYFGHIVFISDHYLTVCISQFESKVRNVNLLIYRDQWKHIKLKKESDK